MKQLLFLSILFSTTFVFGMQEKKNSKVKKATAALWKALEKRSDSSKIQKLLDAGADPYSFGKKGHSLLTYEISLIKIETELDISAFEPYEIEYVDCFSTAVLSTLLTKIPVNFKNKRGQTMLHAAVDHGSKAFIGAVLSYGADPRITDQNGNKPGCCGNNLEVKMYLKTIEEQLENFIGQFKIPAKLQRYWPSAATLLCIIYHGAAPQKDFDELYRYCKNNNKLKELYDLFDDKYLRSQITPMALQYNLPITADDCSAYIPLEVKK